jgi:hypothetical protein
MNIDFNNILDHVVSMEEFKLSWRFIEKKYNILPEDHLHQLMPLNMAASQFLSNYISKTNLHADVPFKRDFFRNIDSTHILEGNEQEIKKWLYQRGIPFEKKVFLSWDSYTSMLVPWKLLIKYFDDFYYADDLTVFDESLNWALLFFHEGDIFFGTNERYILSDLPSEQNYIY